MEDPDANVTVGVEILLAVNVKVTSSPALANVLLLKNTDIAEGRRRCICCDIGSIVR